MFKQEPREVCQDVLDLNEGMGAGLLPIGATETIMMDDGGFYNHA